MFVQVDQAFVFPTSNFPLTLTVDRMRKKLKRRLNMYWQVEAFNAVIVVPAAIFVCYYWGSSIGPVGILCMLPTAALLVVGALYWRGKYRRLFGEKQPLEKSLQFAHQLQKPLLIACVIGSLLCIAGWLIHGISVSLGDRWVATFGAVMAILEYINYYHRQLQHFDHLPDFIRLLTGKGFRPAQMAVDLRDWRASKAA
jgi:hypothetical protein